MLPSRSRCWTTENCGRSRRLIRQLARPLANTALRQLLCNPYVLDKALQIRGQRIAHCPRANGISGHLRQEIVRVDHRAAGGMPPHGYRLRADRLATGSGI